MRPIVELDSGLELAPVPESVANLGADSDEAPPRPEADDTPEKKKAARKEKRRSSEHRARAKLSRGSRLPGLRGSIGQAVGWSLFALLLAGLMEILDLQVEK